MVFNYGDIPDSIETKPFWPLGRNIWKLFKKFGMNYWEKQRESLIGSEVVYNLLKERLNESILTAKEVMEGKIKKPWRVLTYTFFPPIVAIRSDTQQGTMRLLFGDSVDCTFVIIDDESLETIFLLNCHLEDGIPVSYWFVNSYDDLLERRHMKLGYKLKEIPKKSKTLQDSATNMMSILKDIRNERTPQWSHSTYHIANIYISGAINSMLELSNYGAYTQMWDGLATANKRFYNLHDHWFNFIPWPPMILALINAGRRKFAKRWAGWTGNKLFINHIEDIILNWLKSDLPEIYESALTNQWEEGIEFPSQSLSSSRILIKNYEKMGEYHTKSKGPKIHLEDLGITMENAFKGYYLRIDHKMKPTTDIDRSKIITEGLGRSSKILEDK
ncbi:MAG: hypothetical protein GF329_18185 [Candidatus Lokiarchaeota archaeon]|nr:hypothetical protein [Candidatus Lokiarchaeota archaeon]